MAKGLSPSDVVFRQRTGTQRGVTVEPWEHCYAVLTRQLLRRPRAMGRVVGYPLPKLWIGDARGCVVSGRPEAYYEGRLSFQNDEHPSFIMYL